MDINPCVNDQAESLGPLNAGHQGDSLAERPSGMELKDGEVNDRLGFIRKVYMILLVQLVITAGFTAIAITSLRMCSWMQENYWLVIIVSIFIVVIQITLICVPSLARKTPHNYIALLMFTMLEAYWIAFICQTSVYDSYRNSFTDDGYRTIIMAGSMTIAVVAAATTYAWTTKTDFTRLGGLIFVLVVTLFMLGLFAIFFYSYILMMIICTLGVLLYGIFLIFDTQLILGEGRHKLLIDDYILGALHLYSDIIMIFYYLLQLLGARD